MMRTVEARIDEHGHVFLSEDIVLKGPARALVTILESDLDMAVNPIEPAILAQASLGEGWTGKEADEAWKHLDELPDLDEAK
jgi:hypothetical protein